VSSARDVTAGLRERARALAQREHEEARDAEALACFTVAKQAIGVSLSHLLRVSELVHLVEVPAGPPWLYGLTAVEGHLVSLLDLGAFLDLPRTGVADVSGIVVVSSGSRAIGLGAEQLLGIADVSASELMTLPDGAGPIRRMARLGGSRGRDVMLLDVEALFEDPRLQREHG